jgi:ANTAR domain
MVAGWGRPVNERRSLRLWQSMVVLADGLPVGIEQLCQVAITTVAVTGAAVTVTLSTTPRETLFATDQLGADLEELALTLGEGPTVDAEQGDATLAADLSSDEAHQRWPIFADAAVSAGVSAMFALPLQVGAVRLGVLDLYRTEPGGLDREQLADALVLADTACTLLLDAGERDHEHPNEPPPELIRPQHPEVHQATGMLSVQLGVTVAVALIRLRAYAYSQERTLHDVARDIVGRHLRIEHDAEGNDGATQNV